MHQDSIPPGTLEHVGSPPAGPVPRRLAPGLGLVSFVVNGATTALTSVLLPNQLGDIAPSSKATTLAAVTSIGFGLAVVVQPVVGALSDATRGRLGRRAPWMLAGALGLAASLAVLGHLTSVAAIVVCWVAVQVAANTVLGPAAAVMPDRIPAERRGNASAVIGGGLMIGSAAGSLVAGRLAENLPLADTLVGLSALFGVVAFVAANPDPTGPAADARRPRPRELLRGFWVDPRQHPDFGWAFAGRFLFVLGFYAAYTFNFYILTDYVGMSEQAANDRIGVMAAGVVAGALVAIGVSGPLSDRWGRRKPFVYAASLFMAAGLAVPLVTRTYGGVLALSVLFGVGFGLYQACDTVLMTEVLPHGGRAAAKDMGVLNLANTVPQALAPALGGALYALTGGYRALFVAGIVIVLAAAAAVRPIRGVK